MNHKQRAGIVLPAAMLTLAFWAVPTLAGAQKAARKPSDSGAIVVATVNGEKITRAQVAEQLLADQMARLNATNPAMQDRQRIVAGSVGVLVLRRMAAGGGKPVTVTRAEVLDWLFKDKPPVLLQTVQNIIIERAIAQEARKQGANVTPAEVNAKLTDWMKNARQQLRLPGQLSDRQVFATVGIRPEMLRAAFTSQVLVEKMLRKDLAKKMGHAPSPADFVEASHILVKVTPDPPNAATAPPKPEELEKAFEEAKKRIDGYAEEIKSGKKTFEQAANDYSDDTTKFQKGKLGVFMRGQMVPEFEKVAFSQATGTVSEPVRTQFGWHLIRVDRTGAELKPAEREQALQTFLRSNSQRMAMELLQKAKVTNTLSPEPSAPMMMPGRG